MRILGIDYGDSKIGLAFGDSTANVAVPLDVVPNVGEESIETLADNIEAEDVDRVVVGVPESVGEHHDDEQLKKTRGFIEVLRDRLNIPVKEENEAFTTSESQRLQVEEGSDVEEDALAAMLIVKQHIEHLNR